MIFDSANLLRTSTKSHMHVLYDEMKSYELQRSNIYMVLGVGVCVCLRCTIEELSD